MANWSNPTLTSTYTNFVDEVKNRDSDLALGLDPATTAATNLPTNAIRWNSANNRWEKWNGSSWGALSATFAFTAVTATTPAAGATGTEVVTAAWVLGKSYAPIASPTFTGTVTGPSFIPNSATVPSNGLYLPAANAVGIATASTGRVFVDASGNVGIGTSSPGALLHIRSAASTGGSVRFENTVRTYQAGLTGATTGAYLLYDITNSQSVYSYLNATGHIFYTQDTERLRIDSSGNVGVGTASPSCRLHISSTDAIIVPNGTTAQRPASPSAGMVRYNSDLGQFEGYGTAWGSIGGGATGGGSDRVFNENDQTVTTNYTITSGRNAVSAGPVTINSGITVTIPSGSNWAVV